VLLHFCIDSILLAQLPPDAGEASNVTDVCPTGSLFRLEGSEEILTTVFQFYSPTLVPTLALVVLVVLVMVLVPLTLHTLAPRLPLR
jgi:hypothetical protein